MRKRKPKKQSKKGHQRRGGTTLVRTWIANVWSNEMLRREALTLSPFVLFSCCTAYPDSGLGVARQRKSHCVHRSTRVRSRILGQSGGSDSQGLSRTFCCVHSPYFDTISSVAPISSCWSGDGWLLVLCFFDGKDQKNSRNARSMSLCVSWCVDC